MEKNGKYSELRIVQSLIDIINNMKSMTTDQQDMFAMKWSMYNMLSVSFLESLVQLGDNQDKSDLIHNILSQLEVAKKDLLGVIPTPTGEA